ncbi:phosphatase PAP2 family protein [Streptomyces caelestis]
MRPDSSPFPSGRTAAAASTAAAACAVPAVIVAIERVQSGAHHPSDVATGATIGLASAWLTRHVPRLIPRRWTSYAGTSVRCRAWR